MLHVLVIFPQCGSIGAGSLILIPASADVADDALALMRFVRGLDCSDGATVPSHHLTDVSKSPLISVWRYEQHRLPVLSWQRQGCPALWRFRPMLFQFTGWFFQGSLPSSHWDREGFLRCTSWVGFRKAFTASLFPLLGAKWAHTWHLLRSGIELAAALKAWPWVPLHWNALAWQDEERVRVCLSIPV